MRHSVDTEHYWSDTSASRDEQCLIKTRSNFGLVCTTAERICKHNGAVSYITKIAQFDFLSALRARSAIVRVRRDTTFVTVSS